MRTHLLAGRETAVIALGSSEFGGRTPESAARELMDEYVALGGNFIDTARVYGDFVTPRNGESEKVIGRWMRDRGLRDRIVLSTKGGHPPLDRMTRSRLSREEVRQDLRESLEDLGTDHTDLFFLHRDDESRPVGEIMETLQSLLDDKSTRLCGVSNWKPARIREANAYALSHGLTPLGANQPQFSLAKRERLGDPTLTAMDGETWRLHRDTGLPCCCFSSQAKAFFTRLDRDGEEGLPEKLKRDLLTPENRAIYGRIKRVMEETRLSAGAVALAYLTCQPFPTFALAGASRPEQVRALREAGDAVISDAQREFLRPMAPADY